MSEQLASWVTREPPRPRDAVAPHLRRATAGYRRIGWFIWGSVTLVAVMVGATSAPGERLSTGIYGFLGAALVLAVPTQVFVAVNVRAVRDCLLRGVRMRARIVQVRQRGNVGQKIEEIEVEVQHPTGPRHAFATGVTTGAQPGTELDALVAPERANVAALVLDDGSVAIARFPR